MPTLAAMPRTRPETDLAEVEAFLYREARLLDERRFEDWQTLFTDDGYYWVPTQPDQTDPLAQVSIFYDDQDSMRTRIQRLRHPEIHIQSPPSRTVRVVSNIWLDAPAPDADLLVKSTLIVLEYRQGQQRQFGGLVSHALVRQKTGFLIRSKKVELINADGVFGALAVPF
jgi:benzoate/toluate 1,2-dioxygenase beta subunit